MPERAERLQRSESVPERAEGLRPSGPGWPFRLWQRWAAQREVRRRAQALVRRVLSEREYAELRREGFLQVPSQAHPGRTYRIPAGGSPVAALEPDGRVVYLCLQPAEPIPREELVVVQKLLLEGAEDEYWRRANRVGRALGRGFGRRLLA